MASTKARDTRVDAHTASPVSVCAFRQGAAQVVQVVGDLDAHGTPVLTRQLSKLERERPGEVTAVVVDLTGVGLVAAPGIRALAQLQQACADAVDLHLVIPDRLRPVLNVTGLTGHTARHGNGQSELSIAMRITRITHDLLAEPEQEPTLDRVVRLALDTIASADDCGISLRHPDRTIDTPAGTSPLVQHLDDLEYELGEGPCLDTPWNLDTSLIDDVATETRWPAWTPRAAELGVASILSLRVETGSEALGALNLYARRAHAFDHTDVAVASIFARHAGNVLAVTDRAENFKAALRSRQTIGVAQGMLMQRYGLTLDQSFEVLRRYSQEENLKVRDIAQRLAVSGGITDSIDEALAGR